MLKVKLNHQIKAPTLRVISEDGQQIGVMKTSEALALAGQHGLDLVEVSPVANPPVAKLIDFAKFKYQQKKLEQQQKKKAKKTEVKTIWLSMRISEHDMGIKAKKVMEFLGDGDLVRIELRMRGREQAYGELGHKQLQIFLGLISVPFRVEVPVKRMGGTFSVTVAPGKVETAPKQQAKPLTN
ncbi:MAG TPA: translation initiation factor IF-3 [Candidatus Limnocylindria bacterium]|nr:translation initiation factor IF-3 [Candidatus Limnocylindria bacterium]